MILASRERAKAHHDVLLRAVALDSLLGPAWALLATAAVVQFVELGRAAEADEARTASARALAVAPTLAESHLARGMYHRSVTLQHDSAVAYLRTADRARRREPAPSRRLAT